MELIVRADETKMNTMTLTVSSASCCRGHA